jgi:hypothetical protein
MDTFSKIIYASEISQQCRFALLAVTQINTSVQALRAGGDPEVNGPAPSLLESFRAIRSFLTHASNVSRILWPAEPQRGNGEGDEAYEGRLLSKAPIARSRALRDEFGLSGEHVLKSRRLRDLLEHFDEKLDDWRTTSVHRNIVNDFIGPANQIVGIEPTDMMRWFDPSTSSYTFRGEQFDLQELVTAAGELLARSIDVEARLHVRMRQEAEAARPNA